jgi:prepilin-type N-terminal cleavage/methylation domain-containing protein
MYKNRFKGFTLIELLVVIAIIGILSAVVLASLNSARTKGTDAAIQSNLQGIRSQSELIASSDPAGSYLAVCADAKITTQLNAAAAGTASTVNVVLATAQVAGVVECHSSLSGYVASAPLKTAGQYWCVDSTGASKQTATVIGSNIVACP